MKKKYLFLLTPALILIVIAIFYFSYSRMNIDEPAAPDQTTAEKTAENNKSMQGKIKIEGKSLDGDSEEEKTIINRYIEQSLKENDPKICKNINDEYFRDLCLEKIAVKNADTSVCPDITDDETRIMCHYVIYKNEASAQKSIEPCKKITGEKLSKQCIEQVTKNNFCATEECVDQLKN